MAARLKRDTREQVMGDTRRALLAAAAEEFANKGFNSANINRISTSAGFAKGTIYNYFPSKRELLIALIEQTAGAHLEFIAERIRPEGDPTRRLECFFEAGFEFVTANLNAGLVMINTIYGPDKAFKEFIFQAYLPMFQLVSHEILTPGIEAGQFRHVNTDSTAGLIMTVYLGAGSSVDERGVHWLDPKQVSAFVLDGLKRRTLLSE